MAWGIGSFGETYRRTVAPKLPIPNAFHAGPLNITVQEDEFRMAILGRVASFALVAGKSRVVCPFNWSTQHKLEIVPPVASAS
jgi:hypothetical protein